MSSYFRKHNLKPWGLDIVKKCPLIFLENDNQIHPFVTEVPIEDRVNLRCGFEHGEGWAGLVEELADIGTKLVKHLRETMPKPVTCCDEGFAYPVDVYIHGFICKEKFGTLRWQGRSLLPHPFDELWYSYVHDIERKSAQVCEITGNYGGLCTTKNGWLKTLCATEATKLGYTYEDIS